MGSKKRPTKKSRGRRIHLDNVSTRLIRHGKSIGDEAAEVWHEIDTCWRTELYDHRDEVIDALAAASVQPYRVEKWQRALTYAYSTSPLSCAGSVKALGGRFNFGSFDTLNFPPFPALYLSEDRDTAWREKYGVDAKGTGGQFTPGELVLTNQKSITYICMSGYLERVIDLNAPDRLDEFIAIISEFEVPKAVVKRTKRVFGALAAYPRTRRGLLDRLLQNSWRASVALSSVPSAPQVFGQIAVAAGVTAIVFPSTKTKTSEGKQCVAIFPANFASSDSYVQLDDPAPPGCTHTRIDRHTFRDFL